MNKLCYMLCVLYVPTYAMQGFLATAIATTPVTVSGTYHYFKTKKLQNELPDTSDKNKQIEHDTFRPFVFGAAEGFVPPHNFISACTYGPAYIFTELEKWERHEKKFLENNRERARAIGFMAGLSLYATVPLALRCVRR